MKHILAATVLILSSLLAPQMRAASAVTATLSLPHNDVLPGVPFDLVVTYTNVSAKPLTIKSARATLVVTFANGDILVMDDPDLPDQWSIRGSMPARLGPGESVQHAASWERGSIPNWFNYGSSFSGPGTYGVALDLSVVDERTNVLGPLRTPAVTLTRVAPVGIDAELWKRMQEMSGGRWTDGSFKTTKEGDALADEIIQLHPTSGYYPYVLALRSFGRGPDKNQIPALLEAAERFQGSPAYPYLLNAAASSAQWAGVLAERERNMTEAKRYFTLAERKYREALTTESVAIRATSENGVWDVAHRLDQVTKKPVR